MSIRYFTFYIYITFILNCIFYILNSSWCINKIDKFRIILIISSVFGTSLRLVSVYFLSWDLPVTITGWYQSQVSQTCDLKYLSQLKFCFIFNSTKRLQFSLVPVPDFCKLRLVFNIYIWIAFKNCIIKSIFIFIYTNKWLCDKWICLYGRGEVFLYKWKQL